MLNINKLYFRMLACGVLLSVFSFANAAEHEPPMGHPPNFTEEQRACLEDILGKPGEGARPDHETMQAAAESCGVPAPPDKPTHNERPESS